MCVSVCVCVYVCKRFMVGERRDIGTAPITRDDRQMVCFWGPVCKGGLVGTDVLFEMHVCLCLCVCVCGGEESSLDSTNHQ